jgi:hypothetical protein
MDKVQKHNSFNPKLYCKILIHLQTLHLTQFLMCSVDVSTNIKAIVSFPPRVGNHFISSNALCNSDDSVKQLTNIPHFFTTINVFTNQKKYRGVKSGERGDQEIPPFSYPTTRKIPCPERD